MFECGGKGGRIGEDDRTSRSLLSNKAELQDRGLGLRLGLHPWLLCLALSFEFH